MKKVESTMKSSQVCPQSNSNNNNSLSKQSPVDVSMSETKALTFNQFLHSLPKPSVEQTRVWVLKCSEQEHDSSLDQDQTLLDFSFYDRCSITEPEETTKPTGRLFVRFKTTTMSSVKKESDGSELLWNNEKGGVINPIDTQQKTSHGRFVREEKLPLLGPSQRRNSSSEKEPFFSSSWSGCCYLNADQFHKEQNEFACGWNTCDYKEISVDKIFHHVLHSHLHRTTNFRSSRCHWRGCSRDGIVKSFSNRHQLLIHVGIHCQRLKEPNPFHDVPTDETFLKTRQRLPSTTNSVQTLLGIPRRLFKFGRSAEQPPH